MNQLSTNQLEYTVFGWLFKSFLFYFVNESEKLDFISIQGPSRATAGRSVMHINSKQFDIDSMHSFEKLSHYRS